MSGMDSAEIGYHNNQLCFAIIKLISLRIIWLHKLNLEQNVCFKKMKQIKSDKEKQCSEADNWFEQKKRRFDHTQKNYL